MDRRVKRSENSWIENKCQVLDDNGKRCNSKGFKSFQYHGDHELYNSFNEKPSWVRVIMCKKHSERFEDD